MALMFQFESLQAFFTMNGHGIYVWVCYLVTICGLSALVISPVLGKKSFFKTQRTILRRQAIQNQVL